MAIRIAFLGSSKFAGHFLERLLIELKQTVHVGAVWTSPAKPAGRGRRLRSTKVMEVALRYGIPCYTPRRLHEDDVDALRRLRVDIGLVMAYGLLLPRRFFDMPKYGTFNLHFSLLPRYRGASPLESVLLSGEDMSGVTLQKINDQLDTGQIARSTSFPIVHKTRNELLETSLHHAWTMLQDVFAAAPASFTCLQEQDHSQATYCYKITKEDGYIGRSKAPITPHHAYRMWQAFHDWPGLYMRLKGEKYDLIDVSPLNSKKHSLPSLPYGTLERLDKPAAGLSLGLHLKGGILNIIRLKREGKRALDAKTFLHGIRWDFPVQID